jgi:hypothetical protein
MDLSTSSFDSYEQDFNQLVNSIHEKLEGDKTNELGGETTLTMICSDLFNTNVG